MLYGSNCNSCNSGWHLSGGECRECTQSSHCSSGYCDTGFSGSYECESCGGNCRSCSAGMLYGSNCNSCNSGWHRSGGECHECTQSSHCSSGYCDTGIGGSYECESCGSNCKSCEDGMIYGNSCNSCYSGWYLSGGECHECTQSSHCSSGYCDTGIGGTGIGGSHECKSCGSNCKSCENGMIYGSNCDECESGWYLSGGECHECTQSSHCSSGYCDTGIGTGIGGTGIGGSHECKSCGSNCRSCEDGMMFGNNCIECESGWFIKDGVCVECTADSHCGTDEFCNNGYWNGDYTCKYRGCNDDSDCSSDERCRIDVVTEAAYCTSREERPESTQLPERCEVASASSDGKRKLAVARGARGVAGRGGPTAAFGEPARALGGVGQLGSVTENRAIREAIAAHRPVVSGLTAEGDEVLSYGFRHVGNETGLVTTLAYEVVRSRDLVMLTEIDSMVHVECIARDSGYVGAGLSDPDNESEEGEGEQGTATIGTVLEAVAVLASADARRIVEGAVVHGGLRFKCARGNGSADLFLGRVASVSSSLAVSEHALQETVTLSFSMVPATLRDCFHRANGRFTHGAPHVAGLIGRVEEGEVDDAVRGEELLIGLDKAGRTLHQYYTDVTVTAASFWLPNGKRMHTDGAFFVPGESLKVEWQQEDVGYSRIDVVLEEAGVFQNVECVQLSVHVRNDGELSWQLPYDIWDIIKNSGCLEDSLLTLDLGNNEFQIRVSGSDQDTVGGLLSNVFRIANAYDLRAPGISLDLTDSIATTTLVDFSDGGVTGGVECEGVCRVIASNSADIWLQTGEIYPLDRAYAYAAAHNEVEIDARVTLSAALTWGKQINIIDPDTELFSVPLEWAGLPLELFSNFGADITASVEARVAVSADVKFSASFIGSAEAVCSGFNCDADYATCEDPYISLPTSTPPSLTAEASIELGVVPQLAVGMRLPSYVSSAAEAHLTLSAQYELYGRLEAQFDSGGNLAQCDDDPSATLRAGLSFGGRGAELVFDVLFKSSVFGEGNDWDVDFAKKLDLADWVDMSALDLPPKIIWEECFFGESGAIQSETPASGGEPSPPPAALDVGDYCSYSSQCPGSSYCRTGRCCGENNNGYYCTSCDSDGDCRACDPGYVQDTSGGVGNWMCVPATPPPAALPPPVALDVGDSCSSSFQCPGSSWCRGGRCCGENNNGYYCTACDSYGDCTDCDPGYVNDRSGGSGNWMCVEPSKKQIKKLCKKAKKSKKKCKKKKNGAKNFCKFKKGKCKPR